MEIPEKCKKCIHLVNNYCKAYKVSLSIIYVNNCTRKKIETRKERRKRRKK